MVGSPHIPIWDVSKRECFFFQSINAIVLATAYLINMFATCQNKQNEEINKIIIISGKLLNESKGRPHCPFQSSRLFSS